MTDRQRKKRIKTRWQLKVKIEMSKTRQAEIKSQKY